MNVNITGIAPMMACAKGAGGVRQFAKERLWAGVPSDWFDPKIDIGGRGYKYLDVATWYLIAAVKQIDDAPAVDAADSASARKGIIIGSNSSTRRELDEMYRTVFQQGADAIAPMRAPLFCPNMGVGAVGTKQQAKAANITLMNPMTAGLEAVVLAKQAIADGRASCMLAGGMEDDCEFTLGQHYGAPYRVRTTGGAWVLRLEAGAAGAAFGRLGATLNRFVPYAPNGSGAPPEELVRGLERDFAPLLAGGNDVRLAVAALTDRHSRFIYALLRQALARHGIGDEQIDVPSTDTVHGTLLALANLSWLCRDAERAVSVAIGPLGHLTAVEVIRGDKGWAT